MRVQVDSNGQMLVQSMDVRFSVAVLSGDKAAALIMVLCKIFFRDSKIGQALIIAVTCVCLRRRACD